MKPRFQLLNKTGIKDIYHNALDLLENLGIYFEKKEILGILKEAGCNIDIEKRIAYIPTSLVEESLDSAPSRFNLYNREGKKVISLSRNNTIFNPGSAAPNFLDGKTLEIRKPTSNDFIDFIRLTDNLKYIEAQSTALIPTDVPESVRDRYRLYLVLKNSTKPVITGAFTIEGIHVMKKMLDIITDYKTAKKPMAIFDCCSSSPLRWTEQTSQNLIDCAKYGLPIELISVPFAGATAPVTMAGALTVHTAENLSGVVLSQIVNKGSLVIWGGAPTCLDMYYATNPTGAIEASLIDCSYAQIGKYLKLPTHAYLGLSDSKMNDYQGGFESGIGLILGASAGINVISGPGMLDFEDCQSMDKLILDNEICGMAKRLCKGVKVSSETILNGVIKKVGHALKGRTYLSERSTREYLREELFIPSVSIIDRQNKASWEKEGKIGILSKTQQEISKILKEHKPIYLEPDKEKELDELMKDQMSKATKLKSNNF